MRATAHPGRRNEIGWKRATYIEEASELEVTPGIHLLESLRFANCYLIAGDELTLIDTGLPRNAGKVLTYIAERLQRRRSDLTTIVLTHHHFDHTGSAAELRRLTNAKIAVHRDEIDYVTGAKTQAMHKGLTGMLFKAASPFFKAAPIQPDIILGDGDAVAGLTVLHTPGHTPGSISLHDPGRRTLFVGDAIRYINGRILGPSEDFTMDMQQARRSIGKIAQLDFDVMLGGHGEPLTSQAAVRIRELSDLWR
jgi:hydroxyacylglutathione hydrolase